MTEYIKEMIYSANRIHPERIAEGTYKGLDYYVLNLGTHPCAYVDVTKTLLNSKEYSSIDIQCHGGLTYSRDYLSTVDKQGWFIGWDYGHCDDYTGYETMFPSELQSGGKHWSTEEIVDECKNVIDQIERLPKQTNFDRIKAMNIEEMAVMFADEIPHGDCYGCDKCNYRCSPYRLDDECQDGWLEWLESEVEENE